MRTLLVLNAGTVAYRAACDWQRCLHARRVAREIDDALLMLEHPQVFTLGRNFDPSHLHASREELERRGIDVVETDRGGSVTYHGPGQLVAYPVIDLRSDRGRLPDPIGYLRLLERATIQTVGEFGVRANARAGLTGVWVGAAKVASIGVNVSRGVSKHGLALNVSTDLDPFTCMVPCGIEGCRMTSLEELLGQAPQPADVACSLARNLAAILDLRPIPAVPSDLDLDGSFAHFRRQA